MNELERYLDQVCHGIAGPRSLRQHIRQELREHLLDAAERYQAAGLSQEQAIARALDDFGGPEQVRAELEATHGHRLMGVIVDKAMQWKERTMKAKWLWTMWAHVALLLVIVAEMAFLAMAVVFVVPKIRHMAADGLFETEAASVNEFIGRMHGMLADVAWAMDHVVWWLVPMALAWLLFEWRARSENKSMIRLSVLGMLALVLIGVVTLTAAAMILPATLVLPGIGTRSQERVVEAWVAEVDSARKALEQELDVGPADWRTVQRRIEALSAATRGLERLGAAGPSLALRDEPGKVDLVRERLNTAREQLTAAREAVQMQNAPRLKQAITRFDEAYGPATRPGLDKQANP